MSPCWSAFSIPVARYLRCLPVGNLRFPMVPERKSLMVSASELVTSSTVLSGRATYSIGPVVTFGPFASPALAQLARLVGIHMESASDPPG